MKINTHREFTITSVNVYPLSHKFIKAIANIVINDSLAINDLRIITNSHDELTVQWPVSQNSAGFRLNYIVYPITHEAQQTIDRTIIQKYKDIIKE